MPILSNKAISEVLYWITRKKWLIISFILSISLFYFPSPEGLSSEGHRTLIIVIIVLILVIAVFFFLKSKMGEQIDSLSSIKNTQEKLEKNAIQLDEKLIKALEEKIKIETDISKDDHSLPLTLASEIHRMRKRLKIMDDSQGKKVLNKRIENLEDTLNEMGYEIIDLEGQKYNEGMSVQAQFIEDESLGENEKIITKVIKPQINYKDKLIQTAEVQVSQGV